jgi:hypothetical protein
MSQPNPTTDLGSELQELLASCAGAHRKARIVEDNSSMVRITNIPHSGSHMLPGGMSTLDVLSDHWESWGVEYVDNGDTVMYGSKSDKDVVITRVA